MALAQSSILTLLGQSRLLVGGFWDRMVRTAKDVFRKSVGRALLNRDVLEAVVNEIKRVINSRTYDADNPGNAKPAYSANGGQGGGESISPS